MIGIRKNGWVLALLFCSERAIAAGGEVQRSPVCLMTNAVPGESFKNPSDSVSLEVSCPDVRPDHIPALPLAAVLSERELLGQDGRLRNPLAVAAGADGSVWVTVWNPGQILRLKPDGSIEEIPLSHPSALPARLAAGKGGEVYFTDFSGSIGRVDTDGRVTDYPVSAGSQPLGICVAEGGSIYFTEYSGNRIGKLVDGKVTEYEIPTPHSFPVGIAEGSDGSVWFTEFGANQIGRLTKDGEFFEYRIPTPDSLPVGITSGGDGALYFTEFASDQIGRISVDGGIREYRLTSGSRPFLITTAGDGNVYFTESHLGRVGRMSMRGVLSELTLSDEDSLPLDVTAGSDGDIWVTQWNAGRLAQLVLPHRMRIPGEPTGERPEMQALPF